MFCNGVAPERNGLAGGGLASGKPAQAVTRSDNPAAEAMRLIVALFMAWTPFSTRASLRGLSPNCTFCEPSGLNYREPKFLAKFYLPLRSGSQARFYICNIYCNVVQHALYSLSLWGGWCFHTRCRQKRPQVRGSRCGVDCSGQGRSRPRLGFMFCLIGMSV